NNQIDLETIGHRVILSSSFLGSPHQMSEKYHDTMAVVQFFKKPDLFITITCNPWWSEIESNLKPEQQATDRPGLVVRVFELKFQELIDDLRKAEFPDPEKDLELWETVTKTIVYGPCGIVLYNPYLSKWFNCHINTEVCSSIQAIKYIYKYIYKGPDMANIAVGDGQYQQIKECCYRLLRLKMHDNNPLIYHLAIHLENEQLVHF
ncbi:hypothetical protein C7212DRAFT_144238, partial [Tuber magnatum]